MICCSGWRETSLSLTTCRWATKRLQTRSYPVHRLACACFIGRRSKATVRQPRTMSSPCPRKQCLSQDGRGKMNCEDVFLKSHPNYCKCHIVCPVVNILSLEYRSSCYHLTDCEYHLTGCEYVYINIIIILESRSSYCKCHIV